MRDLVHGALAGAHELLQEVGQELAASNELTDDELLARYEGQRDSPWAVLEFTRQTIGAGSMLAPEVVREALRYEREMERLRRERGGE